MWLTGVLCVAVAVVLPLSTSKRITWIYTGIGTVYMVATLLATSGVSTPRPATAALKEHHKKTLELWEQWGKDPCLQRFCFLVMFVEKALRSALAPAEALPGGGTGAPAATALGGMPAAAAPGGGTP